MHTAKQFSKDTEPLSPVLSKNYNLSVLTYIAVVIFDVQLYISGFSVIDLYVCVYILK